MGTVQAKAFAEIARVAVQILGNKHRSLIKESFN